MKTLTAKLRSMSPYSASRFHNTPKGKDEKHDEYDARTWLEKAHFDGDELVIPAMAFKQALSAAAKYAKQKIAGQGNSTYAKKFAGGLIISENLRTGIKRNEVKSGTYFCHADGKRGSGVRVPRTFPEVQKWEGELTIHVLDEKNLKNDVVKEHLEQAGLFIGVGRFRPENEGTYGRFEVVSLTEN